jgi:hypothetical protein
MPFTGCTGERLSTSSVMTFDRMAARAVSSAELPGGEASAQP